MTPLPKRRKRPKMRVREPSQIRCAGHLKWVRGHDCAIKLKHGHNCMGKIEAHHVRAGTDGGVGLKPSDSWTIPLCGAGHKLLHDRGELTFENTWQMNLKAIAEGLARRSPALRKRARALELEG